MLEAQMFIVPNKCDKLNFSSNVEDKFEKFNADSMRRLNASMISLGMDEKFQFVHGDIPVQIWITGQGKDNWQDHGIPRIVVGLDAEDAAYAPAYLPARVLEGLDENATIDISIRGVEIRLKAAQLDFRYRNHGTFAEVLEKMSK